MACPGQATRYAPSAGAAAGRRQQACYRRDGHERHHDVARHAPDAHRVEHRELDVRAGRAAKPSPPSAIATPAAAASTDRTSAVAEERDVAREPEDRDGDAGDLRVLGAQHDLAPAGRAHGRDAPVVGERQVRGDAGARERENGDGRPRDLLAHSSNGSISSARESMSPPSTGSPSASPVRPTWKVGVPWSPASSASARAAARSVLDLRGVAIREQPLHVQPRNRVSARPG